MFKSLENMSIYESVKLSFNFDFFSPLSRKEAASKLAKALGVKILWSNKMTKAYESNEGHFKLEPTYSKGYKELSFSTKFLPYNEAVHLFLKAMNVIDEIGFTTDRCGVKTSILMNEKKLDLPIGLDKLNRLKYLISLNESQIFEWWPQSENDAKLVQQGQLKHIKVKRAYETLVSTKLLERLDPHHLVLAESEFFGNDFSQLGKKTIAINYIGGKGYCKKKKESIDTINLVIENIYSTLKKNYEYSEREKSKIEEMTKSLQSALNKTRSYTSFRSAFPNASLSIDLRLDERMIESQYQVMREKLFEFALAGGIQDAAFNWDSRRQKFQVKGAKFENILIAENTEFFDCTIEGDLKNCLVESSILRNSKLMDCIIHSNNLIKFSKLYECEYLGGANEISASFLENSEDRPITADLRECLIYRGKLSLLATIDSSTRIIE